MSIDLEKRNRLIQKYYPDDEDNEREGTVAVPVAEFFDGNDDIGSLGVNKTSGGDDLAGDAARFETMRSTLVGLAGRPDVFDARCVIVDCPSEDDDEDEWMAADKVWFWTTMSLDAFNALTAGLDPDERYELALDKIPALDPPARDDLPAGCRVCGMWWD